MEYRYRPNGVCSTEMIFDIDENNVVKELKVIGGCNGNLKGISSLVKGMKLDDIISRLSGIKCGYKNTSCPDQIAEALKGYMGRFELMDVYDKNKKVTGKIKRRHFDTFNEGEYALAVKAIIVNSNNEILISKRSLNKRTAPGKWEFCGGVCRAGETSLQGITREVKEELGIDLTNAKGVLFKEHCEHPYFHDVWLFRLDIEINKLKFLDKEVTEAKWISVDEAIKMERQNELINYENLNSDDYRECIKK